MFSSNLKELKILTTLILVTSFYAWFPILQSACLKWIPPIFFTTNIKWFKFNLPLHCGLIIRVLILPALPDLLCFNNFLVRAYFTETNGICLLYWKKILHTQSVQHILTNRAPSPSLFLKYLTSWILGSKAECHAFLLLLLLRNKYMDEVIFKNIFLKYTEVICRYGQLYVT